jgi:hypothetical protein
MKQKCNMIDYLNTRWATPQLDYRIEVQILPKI